MSLSETTLKTAQLKAVNRMLGFNAPGDASFGDEKDDYSLPPAGSSANQWKILVYDAPCRSIISPLLNVSQLRRRGVTLHLLLGSDREPIPDVPVVYFCRPTKANLSMIAQDLQKGLYGRTHVNFVTKLDRTLMEDFAKLVLQQGSEALASIAGMHDQYLDYVCMEKCLFSLHKKQSYIELNGSGATEQVIESSMTEIAYGLFSVVATLGYIPVIRCPRGGAPEMVARKLNKMITEHPTLLRGKSSTHYRPLLVIMDRNSDLITPLQHVSTYQALVDDLLTHSSNRVEFEVTTNAEGNKRPKTVPKRFDLDPDLDSFYSKHKFNPFPEAIEQNGVELEEVTRRETEIRSKSSSQQAEDAGASDLATAVDSLPALLDRKKQLEVHTSILQAVMQQVAARDVPQFYELESGLSSGSYKNDLPGAKKDVLEFVTDPSKGNVEDKIRLVLVYSLAMPTAPGSDIEEVADGMKNALETKGIGEGQARGVLSKDERIQLQAGMNAISYIKQLRTMNMMIPMSEALQEPAGGVEASGAMLTSFMKSGMSQATGLLAKASEKVGSMLGKIHKHHLTRVVENLCDMKPASEDDSYLYLDPKVKGDVDVNALRTMARAPVREVICFMIGGGCYSEYQNLQMIAQSNQGAGRRSVSYGSTEILDPCQFVQQLGQLGG